MFFISECALVYHKNTFMCKFFNAQIIGLIGLFKYGNTVSFYEKLQANIRFNFLS